MKRLISRSLIGLMMLCLPFSMSLAKEAKSTVKNPVEYMQMVASKLVEKLKKNQGRLSDHRVVSRIIYEHVVPHFDLPTMSRSVLGRYHWAKATPAQRRQFQREFTDMIVNTYASAVEQYDGDVIKFNPIRGNHGNYKTYSVSSVVIRPNGNRISVRYKLRRRGNTWRVYDFNIESISMVSSYRSQFSGTLRAKGVGGLINQIKKHNSKVNKG